MQRRQFLAGLLAAGGVAGSGVAFASAPTDRRFVFVILRGGLDGLHVLAPHGDPDYRSARGSAALPGPVDPDGVLDLDGLFGLHPSLAPLLPLWKAGELGFVHGVAGPLRTRSHFDAQDALENGTDTAARPDGWLNRAVGALDGPVEAVAFGAALPLVLRGSAPVASVDPLGRSRAEPDLLDEVSALYADDPVLGPALAAGRAEQEVVDAEIANAGLGAMRSRPGKGLDTGFAKVAGALLAAADGPRVAVVEAGGWDSHHNQGLASGGLSGRLEGVANAIVAFKGAIGPVWRDTVVVLVSEFGRAVAGNGTGGTDHGTGGLVWLAGGAVSGGRVHGAWPGLAPRALFDGRDLAPTTDVRAVLKGLLRDHVGLDEGRLADDVFPRSEAAPALEGLVTSCRTMPCAEVR